ncbi:MAG TPA: type II toxin-antitoxin system PemK/MazF family toxin [Candidatus Brocadiia bacterium]
MTNYKQQDIILVDFGFSEETGSKKRPALIISSNNYHKNRREVIIAAITSNIRRVLFGDTKIDGWEEAGLLYPSLVTGIIRTIKNSVILRKLGILSKSDLQKVQENLRRSMGF